MDGTCSIPDCDSPVKAREWCANHYMQYYRAGFHVCEEVGCDLPARRSGFCPEHLPRACTVEGCGRRWVARGYCSKHWRKNRDPNRVCEVCGAKYSGDPRSRYCSTDCKWRSMRHPLRNALDDGDVDAILTAAREASEVTPDGCWLWGFAKNSAGYGMLGQGGSVGLVHRLVLQAKLGRPLGREPVHHKCANRGCVNPEHLQLTTQRENMAEMFTRTYLTSRISELESALRELDANHPVLRHTGDVVPDQ